MKAGALSHEKLQVKGVKKVFTPGLRKKNTPPNFQRVGVASAVKRVELGGAWCRASWVATGLWPFKAWPMWPAALPDGSPASGFPTVRGSIPQKCIPRRQVTEYLWLTNAACQRVPLLPRPELPPMWIITQAVRTAAQCRAVCNLTRRE